MTEPHQQMDVVKPNDDNSESNLHALIEKVVKDEIKKLASTTEANEVIKLVSVSLLHSESSSIEPAESSSTEPATEGLTTERESDATLANLDSETNLPSTGTETIKVETMSTDTTESLPKEENPINVSEDVEPTTIRLQPDGNVIVENSISDSLLSAVSDLLSSILGLEGSLLKTKPDGSLPIDESLDRMQTVSTSNKIAEEDSVSKETVALEPLTTTISVELEASSDAPEIEQGTEKLDGTTPVGYEGEQSYEGELAEKEIVPLKISSTALNAFKDKVVSEIDLKIENLANSQTSLTESTPEQVTETVRDESVNVLEVISEPSNDEGCQPVSFDDSVNQVMNLVKAAEGQPSLSDSVLIDKNMKEDAMDLNEVVYGTLKEIEASLGIDHDSHRNEIVVLKVEDVPSFENIQALDLKEMQEKPEGNELDLQKEALLGSQEDLKMNETEEISLMKELEKDLEMHKAIPLEPVAEKRGDLIKTLLSEINESLLKENPIDHFIPNSAKAALHYKQADMDEDF